MKILVLTLLFVSTLVVADDKWTITIENNPDIKKHDLTSVFVAGKTAFAVGKKGTILQYKDSVWRVFDRVTAQDLNGVCVDLIEGEGTTGYNVAVVGNQGTILYYYKNLPMTPELKEMIGDEYQEDTNEEKWKVMNSGTQQNLHSVSCSISYIIAVGDQGTALSFAPSDPEDGWEKLQSNSQADLISVCTTAESFLAVGKKGTILRYKEFSWKSIENLQTNTQSIYSDGLATYILTNNTLSSYNTKKRIPTPKDLHNYEAFFKLGDHLFLSGSNNQKEISLQSHYDNSWKLLNSGSTINSIHGNSNLIFAVGNNGVILKITPRKNVK
ncbi:hypothetical protein [Candidatus Uabimicrobium sp. HlEnr_7]|uniref:hypothetical protein n=1 Tax=Candidatus Uabimicrobium helgolandensis TaxID=3095367 RepID=UPI003558FF08